MTHVVKFDILSGHKEIDNLHFILKIIFRCVFIEKHCIFSKLLQLIIKVLHIVLRTFVKICISETMKSIRETIFKSYYLSFVISFIFDSIRRTATFSERHSVFSWSNHL